MSDKLRVRDLKLNDAAACANCEHLEYQGLFGCYQCQLHDQIVFSFDDQLDDAFYAGMDMARRLCDDWSKKGETE